MWGGGAPPPGIAIHVDYPCMSGSRIWPWLKTLNPFPPKGTANLPAWMDIDFNSQLTLIERL